MNDLLIEIGAEEIPAGYIVPALKAFKADFEKSLKQQRIEYGKIRCVGTPRRLALIVEAVSEMQRARTSTITGPPERIGFDENGKPTIAAEKFAEKAGVSVSDITIQESGRGRYLSAVKEEKCEFSKTIIENILQNLILGLPFPKSMRWADLSISFARPIISVAALLGDTPLNCKIGDIDSAPYVFGHPFMFPGKKKINNASEYEDVLKAAGVIVDIDKRRELLKKEIEQKCSSIPAKDCALKLLKDEELVDIVTNLVEYPYPVVGKFDDEFLELPDEVLITAMREHQKYFAITDENGKLKPYFIAVNNTNAKDMELVAKGHEKVIRARLADAGFFYHVDLESTMDDFAEKLKRVTFQASLGSMYEKKERLVLLGEYLTDLFESKEDKDLLKKSVVRAAEICKADLVSQMVIEFTKLQGVIGRFYAEKAGESDDVAKAVEQHYMPLASGGVLPDTTTGQLLAIADKIDTICGCFSIDLIPTGTSDPYALRRQSLGIIQIMQAGDFRFSLRAVIEKSVALYESDSDKAGKITKKIFEFIKDRLANMLVDRGYSRNAVNSALTVSCDNIPDALLRVKALDSLRKLPDFEPLATAFKRVVNILKKIEFDITKDPDESLFEDEAEKALYKACQNVGTRVMNYTEIGDYDRALKEIASLRPDVDRFFDDVMVMVDSEVLKNNRIALLSKVALLFKNIADFSKI